MEFDPKTKRRCMMRGLVNELLTLQRDLFKDNKVKPEDEDLFWEALSEHACGELGKVPVPHKLLPTMTEQEAIKFEKETIEYGRYAGADVGEVPTSYLLFLTEGDFIKRVFKYVRSKRFMERQKEEG